MRRVLEMKARSNIATLTHDVRDQYEVTEPPHATARLYTSKTKAASICSTCKSATCTCKIEPSVLLDELLEMSKNCSYDDLEINLEALVARAHHFCTFPTEQDTITIRDDDAPSKYSELILHFVSKYVQLHEQQTLNSSPALEERHEHAMNLATALMSLWGASHNATSYTKKEASLLNVFIDTFLEEGTDNLETLKAELLYCLPDQRLIEWEPEQKGTFVTHEGRQYPYDMFPILRFENFKREDNAPDTRLHLGAMFHRIYALYTDAQYDAGTTLKIVRQLGTMLKAKNRYFNPALYSFDTAKILDLCFSYLEKSQRNFVHADTARTLELLVVCRRLYRPATRPFEVKLDSMVLEHLRSVRAYGLKKTATTRLSGKSGSRAVPPGLMGAILVARPKISRAPCAAHQSVMAFLQEMPSSAVRRMLPCFSSFGKESSLESFTAWNQLWFFLCLSPPWLKAWTNMLLSESKSKVATAGEEPEGAASAAGSLEGSASSATSPILGAPSALISSPPDMMSFE